eukprot:1348159-Rhodomonas_salina.1
MSPICPLWKVVSCGHDAQLTSTDEDPLWYWPDGHVEHISAPTEFVNDPGGHAMHSPSPGAS